MTSDIKNMTGDSHGISVSIAVYSKCLIATAVFLVTIHLVLNYLNYEVREIPWLLLQFFELDEENNLPTWFSSFVLLNNAMLLAVLAAGAVRFKTQWWILAGGFFILAIDEVAGLHESINTVIDMNWALPALGLVTLIGLSFIPFLWALERRQMVLYCIAGTIFISGAIGVELLAEDMDEDTWAYGMATAVEEGMEMFGSIMFLIVNLNCLKTKPISIRLIP